MTRKNKSLKRRFPGATPRGQLIQDMRRVMELFRQAPAGMIITSGRDHRIQMMNRAYASWLGRDAVGEPFVAAFAEPVRSEFRQMLDRVYRSGEPQMVRSAKMHLQQAGCEPREAYVRFVLQPLRDGDGSIRGIFCQGSDITREKLAAIELRNSRAELAAALAESQSIIETSHDLICTFTADGRFANSNRHSTALLGYEPEELIGRSYRDFIVPEDVARTVEMGNQVAAGEPTSAFINHWIHKDGGVVPIMWSSVWSESRQALYCVGRDMREHAAAEEKLKQAQKMEAIGRLTGGVAHDFNNLLTVVIASAEQLIDSLPAQPALLEAAKVSLDAAQRGAELVRQLLALSRNQPLQPRTIDARVFLEQLCPILQRSIGPSVTVSLTESGPSLCCRADPNQLTAAILNLCINARDAMPGGGAVTLDVRQLNGQVAISVRDTGEGMDEATLERALEPFFTTKAPGKGSGLGLSMVYGFVTQSGGRIEIDSVRDSGTEVRLFLPAADCAEAAREQDPVRIDRGFTRKVVLVEDDDLVRGQVRRQLEALDCEVTDFADPYDALDCLAAEGRIDLLMTDICMPGGMDGRQLADHARLFRPDLPVLFSSGHTDDPIARGATVAAFLPKPYRRADLARKLAEVVPEPA